MADASGDIAGGLESVIDYITVSLKESFAALFCSWQAAAERSDGHLEHVHQLRVTSRRARAALELFSKFLPTRTTERLLQKLDNVRKSAGPARDCDVFAARLAKQVPNERAKQSLAEHLREQRADAQESLVAYYEKCNHGEQLERQVADLLGTLRPRGRRGKVLIAPFRDWAPHQLRSVSRKFFADSEVDTKHLESLHQFRIRAKQFRYSLELLQPALSNDHYKKAYSDLKRLSRRLGEINDHATAVETLSSLLDADLSKEICRILRRWRKNERRALRYSIAEFTDWWTSRRQRRMRRRLKNATRIDQRSEVRGQERTR